MRVLITGGAGFIGSHLSDVLIGQGHSVMVIDNLSTGHIENIRHLLGHSAFHFARATVTDEFVLDRLASQADLILHLAAAVGVELIVKNPVNTIETNVMGTEVVLKIALRYGCKVVVTSTSEVYGKGNKIPFAEEEDVVLGPTSKCRWSYAASKMVDEFLGLAYYNEYGLDVVIIRLFNTIGPRQTGQYGMVVPRIMRQALTGEVITVYGDGTQSRCFCDVRDVVEALIALSQHPSAPGQVFNVGSAESITITDLAVMIKTITQSKSEIRYVPYSQAYEPGFEDMQSRMPNTSRVKALIGWQPKIQLYDSLLRIKEYMQREHG